MRNLIVLAIVSSSSAALAEPQIPDAKSVTSITQAATLCELTQAGIDWIEKSPKVLAIALLPSDLSPPAAKMELLKACIFTWAYDREVALEISMKQ